jgi:hypothetical protein
MTISAGITAVIANPLDPVSRFGILSADVLTGKDEHCMRWIVAQRQLAKDG